jgi:hypothetical protein
MKYGAFTFVAIIASKCAGVSENKVARVVAAATLTRPSIAPNPARGLGVEDICFDEDRRGPCGGQVRRKRGAAIDGPAGEDEAGASPRSEGSGDGLTEALRSTIDDRDQHSNTTFRFTTVVRRTAAFGSRVLENQEY